MLRARTIKVWRGGRQAPNNTKDDFPPSSSTAGFSPIYHKTMKTGTQLITEERQRQISREGWLPDHDDQHASGELNDAAICYAYAASKQARGEAGQAYLESLETSGNMPVPWPWESEWWKPSTQIRNLAKAGALIAAEIDRLQRLNDADQAQNGRA